MPATLGRASKTKTVNGRIVSAKSKTGDSQCSQAVSDWKRNGMTPLLAAILGKCRASAHARKKADMHEAAGNTDKAALLRRKAENTAPTNAAQRLERAKALRGQRAEKQVGNTKPATVAAPTRGTAERLAKARQLKTQRTSDRQALEGYTASDYRTINAVLRGQGKAAHPDAVQSKIAAIDRATNKKLNKDTTLYRGIDASVLKGIDPEKLVGRVVPSQGFTSTSTSQDVAYRPDFNKGVIIKINAPKGTRGATIHGNTGEKEVVLARNTQLKFTKVSKGGFDDAGKRVTVLHADVVGGGLQAPGRSTPIRLAKAQQLLAQRAEKMAGKAQASPVLAPGRGTAERIEAARQIRDVRNKSKAEKYTTPGSIRGTRLTNYRDNASDNRGNHSRLNWEARNAIRSVQDRRVARQDRISQTTEAKRAQAREASDIRRFGAPLDYRTQRIERDRIAGGIRARRSKGGDYEGRRISQIPYSEKLVNARQVIAQRAAKPASSAPSIPAPKGPTALQSLIKSKSAAASKTFAAKTERRAETLKAAAAHRAGKPDRETRIANVREYRKWRRGEIADAAKKTGGRQGAADALKNLHGFRVRSQHGQQQIAEQSARAEQRQRAKMSLFGGQLPSERPLTAPTALATPKGPSKLQSLIKSKSAGVVKAGVARVERRQATLKAAAEFRAKKGTVSERAKSIHSRLDSKLPHQSPMSDKRPTQPPPFRAPIVAHNIESLGKVDAFGHRGSPSGQKVEANRTHKKFWFTDSTDGWMHSYASTSSKKTAAKWINLVKLKARVTKATRS